MDGPQPATATTRDPPASTDASEAGAGSQRDVTPHAAVPDVDAHAPPNRQSIDELREIVGTLFTTPSKQLPVIRLPQLIKKLDKEKGIKILAEDELESLEAFAQSTQGLMLAEDEMLNLLVQMMPSAPLPLAEEPFTPKSPSPPPPSSSPLSSPNTSRRSSNSSRIRSASDSSSSSNSSGDRMRTIRSPSHRRPGADAQDEDQTISFFAAGGTHRRSASVAVPPHLQPSGIPRRPKTTSSSSSSDPLPPNFTPPSLPPSVLATPEDVKDEVKAPSSWERFSKPAAPSRRRSKRISADLSLGGAGGSRPPSRASDVGSEDGERSESGVSSSGGGFTRGSSLPPTPSFAPPGSGFPSSFEGGGRRMRKARQVSHSSAASVDSASLPTLFLPPSSPPLPSVSHPERSLSPGGVDEQSFFALPPITRSVSSPTGWETNDDDKLFERLRFPGEGVGHGRELSVGEEGGEGEGEVPEGGVRLTREPSTSTFEMSSIHDRITLLSKTNLDLSRTIGTLKEELDAKAADYEAQAGDLLVRIEELKVELGVTRREEKELRGKEAGMLRQIATFEADIANLHKSLERSKTQYSSMVKLHQEQTTTSEELRNAIREKDLEAVAARETIDGLRSDADKWLRDQEFLEETQARLLQELETARQAETYLDAQKVENLSLKETINRLRADLDELRLNSSGGRSPGGVSMSRSGSRKDASDDGTMGKSLEKELWRQLMAGKVEEGEEGDQEESGGEESPPDGDDSYIETFITTSRRRIHGQRSKDAPRVIVEHQPESDIRDFEDVGTQVLIETPKAPAEEISIQTDESTLAGLPAYSPKEDGHQGAAGSDDETMATLPEDDSDFEQPVLRRSKRSKVVQNIYNTFHYAPKDDSGDPTRPSFLDLLTHYGAALSALGVSIFIVGLHLGRSNTPGLTPFHHALGTDFAVWNSYNDLARGQGVGIGFAHGNWDRNGWWGWLGVVGAGAANRLARVPT